MRSLLPALMELERGAALLQPVPLVEREWFELLRQKLVPQLGEQAFLVVAVVGGTNIGKSVIFNHLAGSRASATSPLASGTKHATCLVPEGFNAQHDLQSVFPDFELHEWSDASLALEESDTHRLFWRVAPELPPSLLVLDTPDIDSDARVNWVRADAVRRSADVLIAVLTQQKYNDAAVKEFFRKAGDEDKAVMVIFNQCLLPEDEPFWPIWLDTFCRETHITPDAVYLTPNDRRAAEELRLPFFERHIPAADADQTTPAVDNTPRDLAADLAKLRFREIRMRTLLGSLHVLTHPQRGIPAYLRELRIASDDLGRTATRLTTDSVVQVRNWPSPANSLLVAEIRHWWHAHQEGWARTINSAYNTVGSGLLWPIRAARRALQGEPVPPMEDYRSREWLAVLGVVEELFDKLQWMADSGNEIIRPRIEAVLQGESRSRLLTLLRQKHDAVDFEGELTLIVDQEMQNLQKTKPDLFGMYRQLNNVSAAVTNDQRRAVFHGIRSRRRNGGPVSGPRSGVRSRSCLCGCCWRGHGCDRR
ncbi:MAG: GTPase [Planctomycetaceae bacterium]